jgi:acetoin utilization deacetylase AcuC-like enzyme
MGRTGLVWDERYAWHNPGVAAAFLPAGGFIQPGEHVDDPQARRRIVGLLEVSGLRQQLDNIADGQAASRDELLLFHTPAYVDRIQTQSAEGGGNAGDLTPFGAGGYDIAALSVGGGIAAGRAILQGRVRNAWVLNRPPGHHAEADKGRGFCIFNNGVIAVRRLRQLFGLGKVALVDWDVHHGNGAQQAFFDDPSTLTVSVHQYKFYPSDSGFIDENGTGPGLGYNINVPLPPGSGHGAYLHAFNTVVLPALERYRPELIVVCCGFAGNALESLGRTMASSATYRWMTQRLVALADSVCQGRLLLLQEGGFMPAYTPFCGLAVAEALSGIETGVADPYLHLIENMGMQDLQPHQAQMIDEAAALLTRMR